MRLDRLARWCYRRRRRVLVLWIVSLVLIAGGGGSFAAEYVNNFDLPGTDSQAAYDTLEATFPQQSGDTAQIVFRAEGGVVLDPEVRQTAQALLAEVAGLDHVVDVQSPYDDPRGTISQDGSTAIATVLFDERASEVPLEAGKAFVDTVTGADTAAVDFEAGGEVAVMAGQPEPGAQEAIGLLAAVVILLVAFGSLLAMGLPLVTALIGIGIGLSLVSLLGHLLDVPSFAPQVAAMIGIGVGIDYALFVVTRHRAAMLHGKNPEEATVEAVTTAGRAVLFAGAVVVLALLGMLVMDFVVVRGVALAASSVVLVTMLASVTLLPALLGFSGHNINRFKLPWAAKESGSSSESMWFRWSRVVQRRPWPIAIAGTAVLVLLSVPLFSMRLGVADAGNSPESTSHRRAYDLVAEGFGGGANGPFLLVADLRGATEPGAVAGFPAELAGVEGVAFASPPRFSPQGDAAIITVIAGSAPQDPETDALLTRLRDEVVPSLTAGTGVDVHVGGITASFVDFGDKIAERLPVFIAVVIVLSFLLLTAVFRSPLVALKAAVLNLLSISAAYGVIVAVFQWGWAGDVLGIGREGPIESWVPMMMFATLFGLSMDYEVFLISRIREEYRRTGDNALAVADGLAKTARVITAAAAIMISVFLSFVFGDERVLKLMGVGLATAIFVDATVVRLVLVPSTMELLGDRNWWLPAWLDRILPDLDVEAASHDPGDDPDAKPSQEPALA